MARFSSFMALTTIAVISIAFSFEGCVQSGAPALVLDKPRFVPQSQPGATEESGIGQDPATGGMFLQWYTIEGAAEYKLYRSDTTDAYGKPFTFTIAADIASSHQVSDTSTVDASVRSGVRYYYYLRAYNTGGSFSPASDTINYALLITPTLDRPRSDASVDNQNLYFQWADRNGGGFTVIRLKDITSIPPIFVWISSRFTIYGTSTSRAYFNFDSSATSPLISGHSYQWRVDRFDVDSTGRPCAGSRSVWSSFTVK